MSNPYQTDGSLKGPNDRAPWAALATGSMVRVTLVSWLPTRTKRFGADNWRRPRKILGQAVPRLVELVRALRDIDQVAPFQPKIVRAAAGGEGRQVDGDLAKSLRLQSAAQDRDPGEVGNFKLEPAPQSIPARLSRSV